jgi:hypothetical protein
MAKFKYVIQAEIKKVEERFKQINHCKMPDGTTEYDTISTGFWVTIDNLSFCVGHFIPDLKPGPCRLVIEQDIKEEEI